MNDLLKSDAFVRTRRDTYTGETKRQWLEYADGVMEPVRKGGSLGRKFHGNKRALDWWTVEKPLDWDPAGEGRKVSLNHDYGQPENRSAKPATPPASASAGKQPAGPARTLLAMGAQAAKESGAGKGQSAPQAAEDLKQWERGQGIDPNQGSGHENRPPSSSRDAAQMGKAEQVRNLKEYADWLNTMKNNPPWADEAKTPAQKVQGVTHPAGESVGGELLEQMLKGGSKGARVLGYGLGGVGRVLDILGDPGDAW